MGFNTTVLILNDRFHEIEENPAKFVEEIGLGINHFDPFHSMIGQSTIIACHHSSEHALITVGGNCGHVIGYHDQRNIRENNVKIIKEIASQLGYNLVKKKNRPLLS